MSWRQIYGLSLFLLPLTALIAGGFLWSAGNPDAARLLWAAGTAPVLAGLAASIFASLVQGQFGLDIIAALSMAGSLWLGQELAGIVVALMYAGGNLLEAYAQHRARRDMAALLERVPRQANLIGADGVIRAVPLADVKPGDRLLVRGGEAVPVDGKLLSQAAVIDESALTGEPIPVAYERAGILMSGATNAGGPFEFEASASAADSTYAQIVRLVTAAQESRAPVTRLADRYALYFLGLTLALAGIAWGTSGDPLRLLAVLVIATPCPLILGVPVAVVSGMSACARRGVLVKSGGVLEALAEARTLLFDKTGTLTEGRARIINITTAPGMSEDRLIQLAASLDRMSQHLVAETIVAEAEARGLKLLSPENVREDHGHGIIGRVEGLEVAVGAADFVRSAGLQGASLMRGRDGALSVHVAVDGREAGVIVLTDELRNEAARAITLARAAGISRFVMVTGDRPDVAALIAHKLGGISAVHAGLTPGGKVEIVRREQAKAMAVMIGDGTNDAPALAAAGVGIAMGARGSAASSDAAGAVVMIDRIDRVAEALHIARHTRHVALQSVMIGMALSLAGMMAAAAGYLTPVQGALLQEAIDAAAVLNALRALSTPGLTGS